MTNQEKYVLVCDNLITTLQLYIQQIEESKKLASRKSPHTKVSFRQFYWSTYGITNMPNAITEHGKMLMNINHEINKEQFPPPNTDKQQ